MRHFYNVDSPNIMLNNIETKNIIQQIRKSNNNSIATTLESKKGGNVNIFVVK